MIGRGTTSIGKPFILMFLSLNNKTHKNCPSFIDRDMFVRYLGVGLGHADPRQRGLRESLSVQAEYAEFTTESADIIDNCYDSIDESQNSEIEDELFSNDPEDRDTIGQTSESDSVYEGAE